MNSIYFSNFLFERVLETINHGQYIKEVSINYGLNKSFGNEYIRVNYNVVVNEDFRKLPLSIQQTMFSRRPHYIFPLSTYAELGRRNKKKRPLQIIEFKHIYETLSAYAILQFENALNPGASIKIKGIDLWPEANYAEKYLHRSLYSKYRNDRDFEYDVSQWHRLHQLANECKEIYDKNKAYFNITDSKINDLFGLGLNDIRFLLLHYEIPIKIKGLKTIEKIHIYTPKLVEALKKEIKDRYFFRNKNTYRSLITYLYDNYLAHEKTRIIEIQKSAFLKHFIIQKGDIIQLNDGRIVVANSTEIDSRNAITIEYLILKVNLQVSKRKRKVSSDNITYVLSEADFIEYKNYTSSQRLSLLSKWMSKRKRKVDSIAFEPDLTVEII